VEFEQKIQTFVDQYHFATCSNLVFDLAIVAFNIWDILETNNMILSACTSEREAQNYLCNSQMEWDLMIHKIQNWTTLSENDRLTEKLKLSCELNMLQNQLHQVDCEMIKLKKI